MTSPTSSNPRSVNKIFGRCSPGVLATSGIRMPCATSWNANNGCATTFLRTTADLYWQVTCAVNVRSGFAACCRHRHDALLAPCGSRGRSQPSARRCGFVASKLSSGLSARRDGGVRVAGVMPSRYVPRVVNDERNVRATCGVSHLTCFLRGVWCQHVGPKHEQRDSVNHRVHRRQARENMKAISRVLVALVAAVAALVRRARAPHTQVLDNEMSLVDGQDRTLTIQQWDTFLNGVFPLDRNRLTREWFHSGSAEYIVAGGGCRRVRGHAGARLPDRLPVVAGRRHQLQLHHAEHPARRRRHHRRRRSALDSVITPNLFPGVSISGDLGNGPGIQEVATFSVDVAGPTGGVAVSNAHGTVTGAAGGVLLRPFARLIATMVTASPPTANRGT